MKAKLAYLAVALVGLVMSYNTNIFKPEEVTAAEHKQVVLPQVFPGQFKLNLDLETGKSIVECNLPITSTDISVTHPTKIVEVPVYKPSKTVFAYDTITEVRMVPVMFTLPAPKPQRSVPSIPSRVKI